MVAVVAIPLLVLMGITSRWRMRLLIVVSAIALAAAAMALAPSSGPADPLRVATTVGAVGLASVGLYLWGSVSAAAWVIAALLVQAFGGLRDAVYAPTLQEQVAGGLMLVVTLAFVVILSGAKDDTADLQEDVPRAARGHV